MRLLKFDQPHYFSLAASITGGSEFSPLPPPPPELDWSPLDHIDAITMSS